MRQRRSDGLEKQGARKVQGRQGVVCLKGLVVAAARDSWGLGAGGCIV